MLLAEADAEPRLDECRIRRRNECVLARASLLDPARRGFGVQVAEILGLLDRVAGELDPHVLPPDRVLAGRGDQVADDAAVAHRRGARGSPDAPRLLDLLA